MSYEIYVMNADGSGQRRLARGAEPRWSPDGKKIAFSRAVGNGVGSCARQLGDLRHERRRD